MRPRSGLSALALGTFLLVGLQSASAALQPAAAWRPGSQAEAQHPWGAEAMQGMTVSTSRGGSDWGSDAIVPTVADLKGIGVNWIAIHPYARIDRTGEVTWRNREGDSNEAPEWIRRPIEEAHRQGLKIMIKPHLAYWGSYSWRGDIAYDSAEEWELFFTSYLAWIRKMARFSQGADAFVVGTELDRTIGHEEQWREITAAVRDEYDGPLTYAANWTDYERVPFWDALDAIGIQAYFPVVDRGEQDVPPSLEELEAGWAAIMARVRNYGDRTGKPIVFTELGYNRSELAPYEPWNNQVGGEHADLLQQLCMQVALVAVANEPSVRGGFLWKWFPGDRIPRDFAMSTPEMRRLISNHWAR